MTVATKIDIRPPRMGTLVRDAKKEEKRLRSLRFSRINTRVRRPKAGALAIFFRSLSMMTKCGINIHNALLSLSRQSEDACVSEACLGMADHISSGHALSAALSTYPNCFNDFQVRIVKVGEQTGKLDEILGRLADYEEKASATVMKVKSALSYPAFIFIVCIAMLLIGPPYLFSGIMPMLRNSGQELPGLTKMVMAFSDAVRNPNIIGMVAGLAYPAGYFGARWLAKPANTYLVWIHMLRVPGLGKLLRTVAVARFARAFAIQMKVGTDVVTALNMSASASLNPILKSQIKVAIEAVAAGKSLNVSMGMMGFFPNSFLQILKVGEETGEIAAMMAHLTDMYEQEVDCTIDAFVAMVEPCVMMTMGVIVGILVVALMLPLVRLVSSL